jgi:integral membrane protein (TIGR01906 family)
MNGNKLPTVLSNLLRIVIQVFIPILLILTTVRLLLVSANTWIPIEYRLPGFPDDPYGFTLEDRLKWSAVDIEFLLNEDEIDYFDQFQLASGEPMHNERELIHMEDVKVLVQNSWLAFRLGLLITIFLSILLGWDQGYSVVWNTLKKGATWSLILLGVLIVGIAIAFGILFVGFHQVFFESGTWKFYYSDTFIRLYPERFWRDVFILVALITAVQAGILYWIARLAVEKGKIVEE